MRLLDKVILITGSTTGIGEVIARRCIGEGAYVLIHGRDEQRGRALQAELGSRAAFHADDLLDPTAPKRLVDAAVRSFGRLDAIVNNAALTTRSDLTTTTAEIFDRVQAVNVRAPLLLIQAAHEYLKASHGAVLNIGSTNAYCGAANLLAYSISKGALMTMSRNLADALKGQIRVNQLNVGWVLTQNEHDLLCAEGWPSDWPDRLTSAVVPHSRLISPEEIAAAALFWLSDESQLISGSVIELEQFPIIGRNIVPQNSGSRA